MAGGRADRVVLVSIDGLRPEHYLDPRWPAPALQQLAGSGVRALRVEGVFPTLTYPSHTSILTGATPGQHGIYANRPFEPGGRTARWAWEASRIRVPALWDATAAAGRTCAAVGWPVSVGAPVDWCVPDIWPLDPSADPLEPVRQATSPPGFLEVLEREATGRLDAGTFTSGALARDGRAAAMACWLLEHKRPDLLLLHFLELDHRAHEEGRDGPCTRRALAAADVGLAEIIETARRCGLLDSTAFIVTGDHGFTDVHTGLYPNRWLIEAGLLEDRPDRGEWRAAFHGGFGTATLHLRDPADGDAVARVLEVAAARPEGKRRLFRVLERPELDRLGAEPDSPLALTAAPGIMFGDASRDPGHAPHRGTHGYLPELRSMDTGFVGWSAGFRPRTTAPVMGLTQIAPLVARLLDLPFDAPDGLLLPGLLRE